MTPTIESSICPICMNANKALAQHLRRAHVIKNVEERKLLLNMTCGRVNIRFAPCPVLGCKYRSSRLDKHLQEGHPELTRARMSMEVDTARRAVTVELLGCLRATNPQIAMSSDFDLELSNDDDMQGVEDVDPGLVCHREECVAGRAELQDAFARIDRKERESLLLINKIRVLTRKLRRYQKVVREVSAAGWKLNSIMPVFQIILIILFSFFS